MACKKTYYKETKTITRAQLKNIKTQVANHEISIAAGKLMIGTLVGSVFGGWGTAMGVGVSLKDLINQFTGNTNSAAIDTLLNQDKASYRVTLETRCTNHGRNGCYCQVTKLTAV